jgi:hypothetical protein
MVSIRFFDIWGRTENNLVSGYQTMTTVAKVMIAIPLFLLFASAHIPVVDRRAER